MPSRSCVNGSCEYLTQQRQKVRNNITHYENRPTAATSSPSGPAHRQTTLHCSWCRSAISCCCSRTCSSSRPSSEAAPILTQDITKYKQPITSVQTCAIAGHLTPHLLRHPVDGQRLHARRLRHIAYRPTPRIRCQRRCSKHKLSRVAARYVDTDTVAGVRDTLRARYTETKGCRA